MNTAWRRSHPVALVAALIDSVKDTVALILAMLAIALPNRDAPIVLTIIGVVIALLVACMLVFPVLRWLTTRYRLDENGVTQRSGMLNRKRTTISYDHIHAISSSSPIYMRPFQVVTLDITAAGGESGITLRGVPSSVQLELEVARQAREHEKREAKAGARVPCPRRRPRTRCGCRTDIPLSKANWCFVPP